MSKKKGIRPCINRIVQLLDILEDSSIDLPVAMHTKTEQACQHLSGYLFDLILSQKGDLEHQRSTLKKFLVLLLSRTFGLLRPYATAENKTELPLNLRHSVLLQMKTGLIRIFHLINYQPLEEIFEEQDRMYHTMIKHSL